MPNAGALSPYMPGPGPQPQSPSPSGDESSNSFMGPPGSAAPTKKQKDFLTQAMGYLMFGRPNGEDAPPELKASAMEHLASVSPGAGAQRGGQDSMSFTDTNYPQTGGGRVPSAADSPISRPQSRDRGVGAPGGQPRPSSPGRTNGSQPVTAQPQSSDPGDLDRADLARRMQNDPAMAQLKQQLSRLDNQGGQLNLAPLAALADSWTGGHQLQGYDQPLTTRQIEGMKTQIAEQLARRQGDLEWHLDRNKEMAARTNMMGQVADTRAQGALDVQGLKNQAPRPAGRGGSPKTPPEMDPAKVRSYYAPMVTSHLHANYDDPTNGKQVPGAAREADSQLMHGAQVLMQHDPQRYPNLQAAYGQALQDAKQGLIRLNVSGLRPKGSKPTFGEDAAGGDGD